MSDAYFDLCRNGLTSVQLCLYRGNRLGTSLRLRNVCVERCDAPAIHLLPTETSGVQLKTTNRLLIISLVDSHGIHGLLESAIRNSMDVHQLGECRMQTELAAAARAKAKANVGPNINTKSRLPRREMTRSSDSSQFLS